MRVIGLTGSIGSGKSAAAKVFEELGAYVLDADILAREVVEPGTPAYNRIVELFGSGILSKNGNLDRSAIAQIVFQDPLKRKDLEAIIHPAVRQLFSQKLANIAATDEKALVLAVIPLLFESSNPYPEIEAVIVVHAPDALCIERIMKRDSCSPELAEKKLASQLPQSEKIARADYTIQNDGTLAELKTRTVNFFNEIKSVPS
jgi:dephospho-CoA kinase